MSYIEDYGLDSFVRSRLLLLLGLVDTRGKKEAGILKINKELRYFQYLTDKKNIEFSPFNLGDVSDDIRENVDELVECGLIDQKPDGTFFLTEEGEEAEKEVSKDISEKERKALAFSKEQLNDLSTDELLGFMYFLLPHTAVHSTEIKRIEKNKENIVKSLYNKGKISVNTAGKWLNLSKRDIIDKFGLEVAA